MKNLFLALIFVFLSITTVEAQRPRRTVGYQPQIIWLPQGTYLRTGPVVVSSNRRYVKIGVNIGFSSIPRVDTFNFVNSEQR